MRLPAPALSERYAQGMRDEGAAVLDVGMVGTEMLYWTVGSRGLDGGLMCTASHNPKAYTGAKLVGRGALALSGDSGIGELREIVAAGEPGAARRARPGELRDRGRRRALPRRTPWSSSTPPRCAPMKVVLDGGNGMAGQMCGPLLDTLPLEQVQLYWEPDGDFPDHEPNPLLEENRRSSSTRCSSRGRRPGHRLGRRRRPLLLHRRHRARSWTATSSPRCWPSRSSRRSPARRSSTTCAPRARCATWWRRPAARAHVNRVGHAFFKTRMRDEGAAFGGEVSGHYYFRDFYSADSGTLPALLILELLVEEGARR